MGHMQTDDAIYMGTSIIIKHFKIDFVSCFVSYSFNGHRSLPISVTVAAVLYCIVAKVISSYKFTTVTKLMSGKLNYVIGINIKVA